MNLSETPEQTVSKQIQSYLDARHIYNDRLNAGKVRIGSRYIQFAKNGTPDRWCLVKGKMVFIEVKRKGKKPTPEQLERHEELRSHGAVVIVSDSLESFIESFEGVDA